MIGGDDGDDETAGDDGDDAYTSLASSLWTVYDLAVLGDFEQETYAATVASVIGFHLLTMLTLVIMLNGR